MIIKFYIQNRNSEDYDLYKNQHINYDIGINIDKIRTYLINHIDNDTDSYFFTNLQYKIVVEHKDDIVVNVYFEYEKQIKREIQINKVLDEEILEIYD